MFQIPGDCIYERKVLLSAAGFYYSFLFIYLLFDCVEIWYFDIIKIKERHQNSQNKTHTGV